MAEASDMTSPTGNLLDERTAAKFLGVSPRVLWGLADAGSIPFIRIGPRLKRYDPRDLQEFIDRNRRINRPACDRAASQDVAGR
jgi:predicted DNA-binding transcriptional regulator AlpA